MDSAWEQRKLEAKKLFAVGAARREDEVHALVGNQPAGRKKTTPQTRLDFTRDFVITKIQKIWPTETLAEHGNFIY
ncbi:MAG: hypothetical protein IH589_07300 [Anaerolineales bacterium]|nr:hypothetical protein [Anaerolineales bacterium]